MTRHARPATRPVAAIDGAALVVAAVAAVAALRPAHAGLAPALQLIGTFAPWLFLPLPLLVAWALIRRTTISILAAVLMVVVFAGRYGELYLPRAALDEAEDEITVMTFNLGPKRSDPLAVAEAIAAEDADIVVLQEVTPRGELVLLDRLESVYPHRFVDSGPDGRGLLSRFPVLRHSWLVDAGERRTLRATIRVGERDLELFAPHPRPPRTRRFGRSRVHVGIDMAEQELQLEVLSEVVDDVEGSVIVAGDLNVADTSRAYVGLTEHLRDAFREAGRGVGFTFPVGLRSGDLGVRLPWEQGLPVPGPLIRLDVILHSPDLVAQRAKVVQGGGSDHAYVVARMGW